MKRIIGFLIIALLSITWPAVTTHQAEAQDQIYVTPAASEAASDIVNGRVGPTTSVEIDGEMHRVTEFEISSAPKGELRGSILVETPGGERSDGAVVYFSHTPQLTEGELVQLALLPATETIMAVSPVATGLDLPVFSVAGGIDGAWGLLPDLVGRASAVTGYLLTGQSIPDFDPAVGFQVNVQNSPLSRSETIAGVQRGFQLWEDDAGSDVDFRYDGETTKVAPIFDGVNTLSWVPQEPGTTWLGQASWYELGNNEVVEFDIRMSIDHPWSNGAASGKWDLATVVGHEVGHTLGLTHDLYDNTKPPESELMNRRIFAGQAKGLGAGDRAGVAFLYPATFDGPVCNGEPVTVNLATGQGAATQGRDVILGTDGDDSIWGLGGDDLICAGLGVDNIYAGLGNDVVFGEGGSDRIWGQAGADEIHGGSGADRIYGGLGSDTIWGNGGQDSIWGEEGDDDIQGNWESDKIWGGAGNDTLRGAGGKDRLYGGEGNDSLFGGLNTDYLNGGTGTDSGHGQRGADKPLVAGVSGCEQLAVTSSC